MSARRRQTVNLPLTINSSLVLVHVRITIMCLLHVVYFVETRCEQTSVTARLQCFYKIFTCENAGSGDGLV